LSEDLCYASVFIRFYEKVPGKKRSEWGMHVIVCRGDHVIAENFVNKRIGNKNINNDRYDFKILLKKRNFKELCAARS